MNMRRVLPLLLLLLLNVNSLSAAQVEVPEDIQAAIFKRIFRYTRTLQEGQVRVLVVHSDSAARARRLLAAFEEVEIEARAVKLGDGGAGQPADLLEQLGPDADWATVLYLLDPEADDDLKRICVERGLLTITGTRVLVESGKASVGLDTSADNRPEIVIHLNSTRAEGHEMSAELLKLATIVR